VWVEISDEALGLAEGGGQVGSTVAVAGLPVEVTEEVHLGVDADHERVDRRGRDQSPEPLDDDSAGLDRSPPRQLQVSEPTTPAAVSRSVMTNVSFEPYMGVQSGSKDR
jgi:hypothetical protein